MQWWEPLKYKALQNTLRFHIEPIEVWLCWNLRWNRPVHKPLCDTLHSCCMCVFQVNTSERLVRLCMCVYESFNSAQRSAAVKYALKRSQLRTFWSCINIWWATWLKRVEEHFHVPSSCSFTAAARKRPHLNIFRWEDSNNPESRCRSVRLLYLYTFMENIKREACWTFASFTTETTAA